ncbi:hypothetical protein ACOME3_001708 [Neoechinorhynchus agilis]
MEEKEEEIKESVNERTTLTGETSNVEEVIEQEVGAAKAKNVEVNEKVAPKEKITQEENFRTRFYLLSYSLDPILLNSFTYALDILFKLPGASEDMICENFKAYLEARLIDGNQWNVLTGFDFAISAHFREQSFVVLLHRTTSMYVIAWKA